VARTAAKKKERRRAKPKKVLLSGYITVLLRIVI
jgi:hypothetical protein